MEVCKIISALEEVSDIFYSDVIESGKEYENYFKLISDGYSSKIVFLDVVIYKSYDDEREWVEKDNDYEPLVPYLKRKCNEIIDDVASRRFK